MRSNHAHEASMGAVPGAPGYGGHARSRPAAEGCRPVRTIHPEGGLPLTLRNGLPIRLGQAWTTLASLGVAGLLAASATLGCTGRALTAEGSDRPGRPRDAATSPEPTRGPRPGGGAAGAGGQGGGSGGGPAEEGAAGGVVADGAAGRGGSPSDAAVGASGSDGRFASIASACARASACAPPEASMGTLCGLILLADPAVRADDSSTTTALARAFGRCLREAATCAEVRACSGATPDDANLCAERWAGCRGDTLVECSFGEAEAVDCRAAGLVCGESATSASCGTARCDAATFTETCQGSAFLECNEGTVRHKDCAYDVSVSCGGDSSCMPLVGGTCGNRGDGSIGCVGTDGECDEDAFVSTCQGSRIVSCRGGRIATFDCAQTAAEHLGPATCRERADGPRCEPVEITCDPTAPPAETCQDGAVTFCMMGQQRTIDCAAHGLGGCRTMDLGGVDGWTALCTSP